MHQKHIRRIRFPQDPNPELEKHPMSLEASQSSRESTRYPRDSKPLPGVPPRTGFYVSRMVPSGFRGDCDAERVIGCFPSSGSGEQSPSLGDSPPIWGTVPPLGGFGGPGREKSRSPKQIFWGRSLIKAPTPVVNPACAPSDMGGCPDFSDF